MTCQFIHNGMEETTERERIAATRHDEDGNDQSDVNDGTTEATTAALHHEINSEHHDDDNSLKIGDHVYQWRSLAGIPWVFQHHGIVMDVIEEIQEGEDDDTNTTTKKLIIADFSNVENQNRHKQQRQNTENTATEESSRSRLSLVQEGVVRTYTDTEHHTWHKVHYEAPWWKRQVYRSGTATKARSDSVGLVLARVHFILQHPHLLPDYHVLHANCECVAFWCKTGIWGTLQASSFLELTAAGQVKSSATLAATAAGATTTITAPAAGLWGWMGYTNATQVSWLSLHPMAIPGLAAYAAITVGVPAVVWLAAKKQWKATTSVLSDKFWEHANEHPQVFAECMTHWSEKG